MRKSLLVCVLKWTVFSLVSTWATDGTGKYVAVAAAGFVLVLGTWLQTDCERAEAAS